MNLFKHKQDGLIALSLSNDTNVQFSMTSFLIPVHRVAPVTEMTQNRKHMTSNECKIISLRPKHNAMH